MVWESAFYFHLQNASRKNDINAMSRSVWNTGKAEKTKHNKLLEYCQKMACWSMLNEYLLLEVFSYLPIKDLSQAGQVCKYWNFVSSDDWLCKRLFHVQFKEAQNPTLPPFAKSWRSEMKRLLWSTRKTPPSATMRGLPAHPLPWLPHSSLRSLKPCPRSLRSPTNSSNTNSP